MKNIVMITLAGLLTGSGLTYLACYFDYTPVLESYVEQINSQNNEISQLVQINCVLQQTVDNKEKIITTLESDINNLEDESTNLKATIAVQQDSISTLETQNKELTNNLLKTQDELRDKSKEITALGSKLSDILDIEVSQYYEWTYSGAWKWDIPITLLSYVEYRDRSRPYSAAEFVDMVKESQYDPCIVNLVNRFRETANKRGFSNRAIANYVAAFVQSMPYTIDYETKMRDEYPRYPVETLFYRGGDCEDTSILIATLLDGLGIDVVILELTYDKHMAVGVNVPVSYGTYYEYLGTKYWYLETTSKGWSLGQYPTDLKDGRAHIYPIRG